MTREAFLEKILYNEPEFNYNGVLYGICRDDRYYLYEYGKADQTEQEFQTAEELLDKGMLRDIPFSVALKDLFND